MASYRIGIGSFNLKDSAVGIGTESTGLGNLKVEGTIKTNDLAVGVSTFTKYAGFEGEEIRFGKDITFNTSESKTYTITVKNVGGVNIFLVDGVNNPALTLARGSTYIFDQSADTNGSHPLRFKDIDGNSFTSGVTATGTAGSLGATVTLVVASDAPNDLRYYCTSHGNAMGNLISVVDPVNVESVGEDLVIESGTTFTVGSGATACVGSVESISVKHHFSVPVGDTSQRDTSSGYQEGVVRYNRDLGTMEFFNGNEWRQFTYQSDISNSPSSRGRALFGGGSPSMSDISFVNIMTEGNARDFGDLTYGLGNVAGKCSNGTRGLFAGGGNPVTDTINYITIASEGDGIDFGNLTANNYGMGGHSSSTRGIWAGGNPSGGHLNVIQYVEINTTGNALDFGDLTRAVTGYDCACGDPVRMLHAGGKPSSYEGMIDLITISSKGNAKDFGDLSQKKNNSTGVSNNTRGVWCRGELSDGVNVKRCDYVTISSGGKAIDFGSISAGRYAGGASNQIRGVIAGGYASSESNLIEFITIATKGNAVHFGDDTQNRYSHSGLSDSHGGLGGY